VPLVVGLGNPGSDYARTRHNVGWRVLEALAARWRTEPGETTGRYRTRRASAGGRTASLMWPLTFMNLSGEAVVEWRERHGLEPADLLVVSDDVYLPVGALRMRARGSSGGHRGLESIEASLATREFARLRLGVGQVAAGELRDHVLERFDDEEEAVMAGVIARAAEAAECWSLEGVIAAMNRFNRSADQDQETEAP
jgi:PTH1 family peptidyl-tRNA hydrolase